MPVTLDSFVMLLGWIGAAAGVVAYAQVSRGHDGLDRLDGSGRG